LKIFQSIPDRWLLLTSLILQIGLGLTLGHAYDDRINLATGYLVGTGQNPYLAQDLTAIFGGSSFKGMTSMGYPPPWPMILGLIYLLSFKLVPNLLLYNLAVKIPIIAANLCLAFAVRRTLLQMGTDAAKSRWAWIFMLFNPFLLLATSAWGQIDSIAALIGSSSLMKLAENKKIGSALLLALAISVKPIAIPLIPAVLVYMKGDDPRDQMRYLGLVFAAAVIFCALPFVIFGWDPSIILKNWNATVTVGGGLSFLSILKFITGSTHLKGAWQILGMFWLPALVTAAILLRIHKRGLAALIRVSAIMFLIFFLFRSWVSEPNVVMLLPLILILVVLGGLPAWALRWVWLLPLVFSFFNMALVQLLFPIAPALMISLMQWLGCLGGVWQILGAVTAAFWMVYEGKTLQRLLHLTKSESQPDYAN
jgi:hypothetical protein